MVIADDFEFKSERSKINKEGFRSVLNSSKELILDGNSIKVLNEDEIRSIDGIKTDFRLIENKSQGKRRKSGDKGAIDNPRELANGVDIFVRLSAYTEDKRIDFENKKLKPGSPSFMAGFLQTVNLFLTGLIKDLQQMNEKV